MKTFLVPVDYSDNSFRALEYAIELAAKSEAGILVCHTFEVGAVLPGFTGNMQKQMQREEEHKLSQFISKADKGAVELDMLVREGETINQLSNIIQEYHVTLVVMGTGGGKNLVKRMFGTTTQALAKRGLCPVLAIPEDAEIKPMEHIVYAADFENGDEVTMLQLLQLKEVFGASLTFLHIKSSKQPDYIDNEYIKANLLKQFPDSGVEFVEIENRDVAEGISDYVEQHNTSLLAFTMLNKHIIEKVMYGSITSKLLKNLKLPMLALPENGILLDVVPQESEAEAV